MFRLSDIRFSCRPAFVVLSLSLAIAIITAGLSGGPGFAADGKKQGATKKGGGAAGKSVAKGKSSSLNLPPLKTADDKLRFLDKIHDSFPARRVDTNFTVEELNRNLRHFIGASPGEYAGPATDDAYVRRVYLDLTGRVPDSAAVQAFISDSAVDKRKRLVDQLLDSPEYARHWGRYWRNVVFHKATANRRKVNPQAFEDWLADEFKRNTGWDRIVCEMISATPKFDRKRDGNEWQQNNGPNNFPLAFDNDPGEIASQTARIFMGISIACAECHDHPFDNWKREQYHELAAFFAPGKYHMPDLKEPSKKTEMSARFLLGEKPPADLKPDALRVAVAAYLVYNPDNYWFARAYVNRIWSELVGDGFYPVDSLGPDKECVHPLVINRMAAVFRYQDFDVKWVFRTIMSSDTYQRASRSLDSQDKLFTAVRPGRLRPEQVVHALEHVAGDLPKNVERSVAETFAVDPSASQASLEGSLQQALLMMNNVQIQNALRKSQVRSDALAAKSDDQLTHTLYLGTLGRRATDAELTRAREHLKRSSNRTEAVEDLLWILVNSTEFVTKR